MTTRFAIIGAGNIGRVHAAVLAELPDAEILWIVDADGQRAAQTARTSGGRGTTSAEEALSDPDVAAVLVSAPTPLHRGFVELAARYGKHVLCEKPIAGSVAEGEAMIAACEQAGVRLMIGHVVRHFPENAKAREILRSGTLGQIGSVRASRAANSPGGERRWMIDPAAGGGVVIDLMIHDLDTMRWYFGDLERVYALSFGPTDGESPIEYVQALLRFQNGVVAHCEASWAHHAFRARLEIAGEHGLLQHDSYDTLPIRVEKDGRVEKRLGLNDGPYQAQIRHFIDQLQSGEPFLLDAVDGVRALEAAVAITESARSGQPIHFEAGRPILAGAHA